MMANLILILMAGPRWCASATAASSCSSSICSRRSVRFLPRAATISLNFFSTRFISISASFANIFGFSEGIATPPFTVSHSPSPSSSSSLRNFFLSFSFLSFFFSRFSSSSRSVVLQE
uniref:Putative secreted protein n=1 Tax=Panstrongylus lignarius TaxID=156445 RepID=A0A224Y214_9HEMI